MAMNSSTSSISHYNEKNVSKVFNLIRAHLEAKEKELLELQRANSSLLAPDPHQIDMILDNIASLHLSTQDGLFAFTSLSLSESDTSTNVCSTGVASIKVQPSSVWLPPPCLVTQPIVNRLPMVSHILSLPINAYLASSSPPPPPAPVPSPVIAEVEDQSSNRLSMVTQLLSMPINAFVSSSSRPTAMPTVNTNETVNTKMPSTTTTTTAAKSILTTDSIYSKDNWLRMSSANNKNSSVSSSKPIPMELDAHIEECSAKMRRLHAEYLSALARIESL
jgi:hypothetical protein